MIIEYKEIFKAKRGLPTPSGLPYLNTNIPSLNVANLSAQPFDYKKVIEYIKRSPECIGIFKNIISDIVSDEVEFIPYKKQGKKTNVENAEEFWRTQNCKEEIKAGLFDWLSLGDFGIYLGLTKSELKACYTTVGLEYKEDEDYSPSIKFRHVAWSTMRIDHDSRNIVSFSQVSSSGGPVVDSSGNPIHGKFQSGAYVLNTWKPEQIIHGMFMKMDGKVYGYTPTIAAIPQVSALQLIKDYTGNFFENSCIPNWMFIFPKEMAGSPNVTDMEQKLKLWEQSVNKHRSMIFAGEVNPVQLNKFDKDMEFRQLAVYYTGVMAFAYGMPLSRMQQILGLEISSKEDDASNSFYWRNLSESQDYLENLFNSQLWIPYFKVMMRFKRKYLQDDIRESQNRLFLIDGLTKLRALGLKPTTSYVKRVLSMKDDDVEEIDEDAAFISGLGGGRQNYLPNSQLTGNPEYSNKKKAEQVKTKDKRGLKNEGF